MGESLERAVASLAVGWTGVELVEPKVAAVGPDFAPGPKSSFVADHVRVAEPMKVGTEPGQALVPMDSNWLEAVVEVVLGLLASKVAELGLEVVLGPMHSLQVAVAVEAAVRPKVVEVDQVLGPVAMFAAEADAVVAEPMVVAAGILAEPVEPKEVVLGGVSGVVASTVVVVESLFVLAVSMDSGVAAALVLGLDPRLAVVGVAAH